MSTSEVQSVARQLKSVNHGSQYPEYVDRWAIVVGISQYQHDQISLKYAHRDAEELYNLIQTPSGGGFGKEYIMKLVDKEATTANITRALRSFLKKPGKNDIVLIYFACHGSPDPDRPDIVYLLTYDTDPTDIAGTALPMREIELCLKENLLAERVILIADTCHGAAIGGSVRSAVNNSAEVNRYLRELSETKKGIALLTSAEANETAREGKEWGDGHGVFTYYLLEGMRGGAEHDGKVMLGKLFEYVRKQVQSATSEKQHPFIGANPFDRTFPMAITGGVSADEHYRLGCHLFEMGRLLNDHALFASARAELLEAIRLRKLNGEVFPTAKLALGRVELIEKDYQAAIHALQDAVTNEAGPQAIFYLGLTYARQGSVIPAANTFERYLNFNLQDGKENWVRHHTGTLQAQATGQFYVFIIGIGFKGEVEYPGHLHSLYKILTEKYKVKESCIIKLINEQATYTGVLQTFAELNQRITAADTIVIYYSGYILREESESCLWLHDTFPSPNGAMTNALSADELNSLVNKLPAKRKTLIGIMPNRRLLTLAHNSADYALFMTASLGQSTDNYYTFDDNVNAPLFAYGLIRQLCREDINPEHSTYGQLIAGIQAEMGATGKNQKPLFVGDPNRLVFSGVDNNSILIEMLERKNYAPISLETIQKEYNLLQQMVIPFPQAYYILGCAFLEKQAYAEALTAFEKVLQQQKQPSSEVHFALALSHLGMENYADSIAQLQQYLTYPDSAEISLQIQIIIEEIRNWTELRPILLIGIDRYADASIPEVSGAVNDVIALKKVLLERYDFHEKEIIVLINEQATRQAITEAFARVAQRSQFSFGLFYFAGNGSEAVDTSPTIVSYDGRQPDIYDITLQELVAQVAGQQNELFTIIDAGWAIQDSRLSGRRTVAKDERLPSSHRALKLVKATQIDRNLSDLSVQIGRVSIYNSSIQRYHSDAQVELPFPMEDKQSEQVHGRLTYMLLQHLNEFTRKNLSLAQDLREILVNLNASADIAPVFFPVLPQELLRLGVIHHAQPQFKFVDELLTLERIGLINKIVNILNRMIKQRNDVYPEGYLNLGIAYMIQKKYAKAVEMLDKAVAQRSNIFPVAYYYLGRTLFESYVSKEPAEGKATLARAESALQLATEQASDNIAAYYYLGQAIRKRIEAETIVEAERALRTYLEGGAPLGRRDEVEGILAISKQSFA